MHRFHSSCMWGLEWIVLGVKFLPFAVLINSLIRPFHKRNNSTVPITWALMLAISTHICNQFQTLLQRFQVSPHIIHLWAISTTTCLIILMPAITKNADIQSTTWNFENPFTIFPEEIQNTFIQQLLCTRCFSGSECIKWENFPVVSRQRWLKKLRANGSQKWCSGNTEQKLESAQKIRLSNWADASRVKRASQVGKETKAFPIKVTTVLPLYFFFLSSKSLDFLIQSLSFLELPTVPTLPCRFSLSISTNYCLAIIWN